MGNLCHCHIGCSYCDAGSTNSTVCTVWIQVCKSERSLATLNFNQEPLKLSQFVCFFCYLSNFPLESFSGVVLRMYV